MTAPQGVADMAELIGRAQLLAKKFHGKSRPVSPDLNRYRKAMAGEDKRRGRIVTAEDAAVELGAPGGQSVKAVLLTREKNLVRDSRFTLVGPDLDRAAGSRPYAQLIMLAMDDIAAAEPWNLESVQYFPDLLPGLMARMVPGRLWLRASKSAIAAGLNFSVLASAIYEESFRRIPKLLAVESMFVTGGREQVVPYEGLASEARILAGAHQRIALGRDGGYECVELNCEACAEKPVCDMIREVKAIRRKTQGGGGL